VLLVDKTDLLNFCQKQAFLRLLEARRASRRGTPARRL